MDAVGAIQSRVCVVHPGNEWILSRLAHEMVAASNGQWYGAGWTDFMGPTRDDPSVSAVFFVDVQSCWTPEVESATRTRLPAVPLIGLFTHCDRDDISTVRPETFRLDGIVHMCQRYRSRFIDAGYPPTRMTVIAPGQVRERFPLRPVTLGVCQRGGFPGKGDPFLFEALAGLPESLRQHVVLRIKGSGWRKSGMIYEDQLRPMKVVEDYSENPLDYPKWYSSIDVLLVPSLWEGGPMAVQEALATGTPVIAADVGFVPEMLTVEWDSGVRNVVPGCEMFPPGNALVLQLKVERLVRERLMRRAQVEGLSWATYVAGVENFIHRTIGPQT